MQAEIDKGREGTDGGGTKTDKIEIPAKRPFKFPPHDESENAQNHAEDQEHEGLSKKVGKFGCENWSKHTEFCMKLGITRERKKHAQKHVASEKNPVTEDQHQDDLGESGCSHLRAPLKAIKGSYFHELERACSWHEAQYWLTACVTNFLYLLQIVLGATATASSASGKSKTTVTVLTSIATVTAGVLAFLKSRGQPNRARQLRNDLRKVVDYIRFMEMEFRSPATGESVDAALIEIRGVHYRLHGKHQSWSWCELHANALWALDISLDEKDNLSQYRNIWYIVRYCIYMARLLVAPLLPLRRSTRAWPGYGRSSRSFGIDPSRKGDALCFMCKRFQSFHMRRRHKENCICG